MRLATAWNQSPLILLRDPVQPGASRAQPPACFPTLYAGRGRFRSGRWRSTTFLMARGDSIHWAGLEDALDRRLGHLSVSTWSTAFCVQLALRNWRRLMTKLTVGGRSILWVTVR